MLFRSGAAVCGAVLTLAFSVVAARSETATVHSEHVVDAASGDAIVGAASTYNPFRPGWREGGPNTASGERYDPSVWAAAIKTSLRQKFGGVQYGARPKYAVVEAVARLGDQRQAEPEIPVLERGQPLVEPAGRVEHGEPAVSRDEQTPLRPWRGGRVHDE